MESGVAHDLQLYRDVATGVIALLVGIIGYLWKTTADDVKSKMSKEEFKNYLDDASRARNELRESIIKLFEKAEAHETLDRQRFEQLAKDFNGGLNRLTDVIYTTKLEVLRELNGKVDRDR